MKLLTCRLPTLAAAVRLGKGSGSCPQEIPPAVIFALLGFRFSCTGKKGGPRGGGDLSAASPAQLSPAIYPLARVSDEGLGRSQSPDSLWVYRDRPGPDSFGVSVAAKVPVGLQRGWGSSGTKEAVCIPASVRLLRWLLGLRPSLLFLCQVLARYSISFNPNVKQRCESGVNTPKDPRPALLPPVHPFLGSQHQGRAPAPDCGYVRRFRPPPLSRGLLLPALQPRYGSSRPK